MEILGAILKQFENVALKLLHLKISQLYSNFTSKNKELTSKKLTTSLKLSHNKTKNIQFVCKKYYYYLNNIITLKLLEIALFLFA